MKSHKRRLHRIDHRIAEREILFQRSADGVFLAEITDADIGMIGRHGTNRSGVCDTILVYVMVELKYRRHRTLHGWHGSGASRYICVTASLHLSEPDTIGIKNPFAGA